MSYTLPLQQFELMVKKIPNTNYLHQPVNRELQISTWSEVDRMARSVANSLLKMGLKPGDRVGILSKNCAQWFITDIAVIMAGMISIPIYPTANKETISYIVEDSECKVIFVGPMDDLTEAEAGLPKDLPRIAFPYNTVKADLNWASFIAEEPLETYSYPDAEDIMTIAYTSGSSGKPKGVVLTFANFAASATEAANTADLGHDDSMLSYLPLAHITERGVVQWPSIYSGSKIYFVEKLETFIEDLKVAQPALFISVPRLWKKFQGQILLKVPDEKLQKLLKIPFIGSLVAKKIRKGLGLNKTKVFGSGSAPISPDVLRWYERLGMPISEGWGMSETTGLSCSNIPFVSSAVGTIGHPLPCVEMKLGDGNEILIRGQAVFKEYYKMQDVTNESFSDGWFHTGDVGALTSDGEFKIIGRIKEQFKTSKGKFVVPVPIESMLGKNVYIEQMCVVGIGRKQPIALVILNDQSKNLTPEIQKSLENTLKEVNDNLESHQRLDHIVVLKDAWTPNDYLTPTLKLKRPEIEAAFKEYIDGDFDDLIIWQN
ncbi:MAG: AMP-binding protein [Gammaproteobacteria bacterium]|nr:AMP-binding protein [Gammaproteobacteria bacterium]MDH5630367.1 AMP-binding protein [Gammaproteobacteria bacterium]